MGESFRQVVDGELKDVGARREKSQIPTDEFPDLEEFLPKEPHRGAIWADVIEKLTEKNAVQAWKDADRATAGVDDEGRRYGGHVGLVGLAFSGGGIRSATFNLGVLQALHRCGLWPCIDYLSTVSGGGYLGSCLSSVYAAASQKKATPSKKLLAVFNKIGSTLKSKLYRSKSGETDGNGMPDDQTKPTPVDFPFRHERGKVEPPVFRHLRNNANHIAPKDILALLRAPAVLFRGIAINFVVVLPYILFAATITVLAHRTPEALEQSVLIRLLSISGLPVTSFPLTLALVCLLPLIFAFYPLGRVISLKNGNFGQTDGVVRNRVEAFMSYLIVAIFASALIEAQPLAVAKFDALIRELRDGFMGLDWTTVSGLVGGASAVLAALSASPLARNKSGLVGQIGIYILGFLGVVLLWLLYLFLCRWAIFGALPGWVEFLRWPGEWLTALIPSATANKPAEVVAMLQLGFGYSVAGLVLFIYSMVFVDINSISLHTFYCDRLSKA